MTHADAVRMVRGKTNKTSRKIGNNTYGIIHDNGDVGIVLHSTEVVTIHADGTYTLRSGGWRTVTTKDRINTYCPYRVTQRKGEWSVSYWNGHSHSDSIEFEDGMCVSHDMFNQLVNA
jgi:hypothetical protein